MNIKSGQPNIKISVGRLDVCIWRELINKSKLKYLIKLFKSNINAGRSCKNICAQTWPALKYLPTRNSMWLCELNESEVT